jgi:hypothetical protein
MVEVDIGGVAAVHQAGALTPQPLAVGVDEKQAYATGIAGLTVCSCNNQQAVGTVAVEDEGLAAGDNVVITVGLGSGGNAVGPVVVRFL